MTRDTDLILRALVEMFGERCPDFDPDCVGCQAWAEFDRLTARPVQESPSPQLGKEVMPDGSNRAATAPSPGVTAGATGAKSDADFLRDAGMDGAKWAAGFKAVAERLGHHDMDEGWLTGWFCNAIMAGFDESERRHRAATPTPVVPAEGLPDLTCPGIDAAIEALEAVRAANSQMRYGYWHMQEELAALRSAPPVGARVTGWQPIETAPKDGTPVDLWCLNLLHHAKKGFRKTNVSWGTVTDWFGTEREDWRHGRGEDIQPTHWMPLPEPPAALLPAGEGE